MLLTIRCRAVARRLDGQVVPHGDVGVSPVVQGEVEEVLQARCLVRMRRGLHVEPNPPLERWAWLRRQILQRENFILKNDDRIGLVVQVSVVGQVTAADVEVFCSVVEVDPDVVRM